MKQTTRKSKKGLKCKSKKGLKSKSNKGIKSKSKKGIKRKSTKGIKRKSTKDKQQFRGGTDDTPYVNTADIYNSENEEDLHDSVDMVYKYNQKYNNTEYIPLSDLINNLIKNYPQFLEDAKLKQNDEILLEMVFNVNNKLNITNTDKFKINTSLLSNPMFNSEKLISYSFYIQSKSFFKTPDNIKSIVPQIKNQIGKDVLRTPMVINDISYDSTHYEDIQSEYIQIADRYYLLLMDCFKNNDRPINFNLINTICLLSCQNMSNLTSDIIVMFIKKIIGVLALNEAHRQMQIIINKSEIKVIIILKSKLIMSGVDDEGLDPDRICGNLFFKLQFDILNNTYQLTTFVVNVNKITCIVPDITDNAQKGPTSNYSVPFAVSTIGVTAAVPFILGVI
jgi:hypothetical protein